MIANFVEYVKESPVRAKKISIGILSSMAVTGVFAVQPAGYVEQYNSTYISGWACDKHDPDYQVPVHMWSDILRDDKHFLTGTESKLPREAAVGTACASTHSNHGFVVNYSIPANLIDNKWHDVHVFIIPRAGSPKEISNSPVKIFFGASNPTQNPPKPPSPPASSASDPFDVIPTPRPMIENDLGPKPPVPKVIWERCDDYMCY
ncbi:hypothetical protein [Verminephrobacter aporrectodeae]|uniref:hypothetical protein n=2 Tax=Verminephrobacter aporrectodeae TaxID=1110389 RepID=UPI0022381EC8|nr:hypothetical protein [Verminephrobacter aporrectodeae]